METTTKTGELRRADVIRRFDAAASTFDSADFVHRKTAEGLFERLQPMQLDVRQVLELGSATGKCSRELAATFRRARVTSVDISGQMLRKGRSQRRLFSRVREVQADAMQLPFPADSIDLVFSNLLLPWMDDLEGCFGEVSRVLRPEGLFLFSTLGPDSLAELRHAWTDVDHYQHVNLFFDMHDVGDCLVRAGLRDPVLDVDHLNISYAKTERLLADLSAVGGRNSLKDRRPGLTGREQFAAFRKQLQRVAGENGSGITLELVFGHAWGGQAGQRDGEFLFAVDNIGRRGNR